MGIVLAIFRSMCGFVMFIYAWPNYITITRQCEAKHHFYRVDTKKLFENETLSKMVPFPIVGHILRKQYTTKIYL